MTDARPVVVMLLPASDYDPTESAVIWDRLIASAYADLPSGVANRTSAPDAISLSQITADSVGS